MFIRGMILSLTALLAAAMIGGAAEAEQRRPPPPDDYYSGPSFLRFVPGFRILFGDYALSEEEYDRLYGDGGKFDESYYEPEPAQPQKPKKKPATAAQKPATASGTPSAKAGSATPGPKTPVQQANAATGQKRAASGLTCEKAGSVISGYGFSGVTPSSCAGKVYAFNAKRDGKSFAIKLDAASGELTEVKKLP